MLILVEGYLKKRCANLPLMRRRYCMLAVDDSQPSSSSPKIKVMLRSYKHEEARHASIDSFVSSHVVKCIGEWTGKGNLHTYPNAFVVETLQSKLFHCSADTLEDKVRWTTAIAVYDRLSVGSSCTAAVVHTPASYVRLSDATEPGPVIDDKTPATPPPLEAQHHVATDTAAPTTSIRRPSARPMSLLNDALFKSKQGRRGNYNDLDIDSGEEDHVDAVHLDSALIHPQPASSPRPSVENDALDDIPFSYVDAPAMSMQYITVTATNSDAHHVDEEEYLDLNPDMVARFSDMRMIEARGLSHGTHVPVSHL
ncbi:hypothetical protein DYB30_007694 [Aphanomyces astaci]|uniref:PH domain-containing protein n=1 Tax=Aphanomyces astaci TaxID=112090 RepID=A0A397C2K6_APHAT|nr:hypothetical protein DYB30_007694 [Aphanomyces astaci]